MYIHTITLILLFTQTLCFTLICFIAFYVILLFLTRIIFFFFFFSSRRRHTRSDRDWSSDGALPILERAQDFVLPEKQRTRYLRTSAGSLPKRSPGSLGRPSIATREKGERLYKMIYDRVATRVLEIGRASCRERV